MNRLGKVGWMMVLESGFQLGDWLVRPHTNTIEGPGGEARLEPKAMQVLSLLAERPGEVVSKQEILTSVWDGTFVSDEVLPNAVWELRKALGDDAKKPKFIQTLPKKGYRLIAPVTVPPVEAELGAPDIGRRGWSPRVAAIVAVAAAIFAGVLVVRDVSDGPLRAGLASPSSVVVMEFENHTTSDDLAWLSTGVPTMLRTGLTEVEELHVVSNQRLGRVVDELGGDAEHHAIAREVGADAAILGTIFELAGEYRIDVEVERVSDGGILAAHSVRGGDVFQLMDELTVWVRATLGPEDTDPDGSVPPITQMTTNSLDAFRLYNEGVTARQNLRVADARRLLTRAVEIDPDFALAYLELQMIAMWNRDESAYELFHAKMLEHREQLPRHRRVILEAQELWKDDPERAEQLLLGLIERRPDEEEAYLKLAHLYQSAYDYGKALDILELGTNALPHSGYLRSNYGYRLLWQGRYPEAFHQLELYSRIHPDEANPFDSLGEAYLIAGIPERALEEYAKALKVNSSFPTSHLGRAWAFASMGRFDQALAEVDSIEGELPFGYSRAEVSFMNAYFLSRAGRYRETRTLLDGVEVVAQQSPTLTSVLRLFEALLWLERGEAERALPKALEAQRSIPEGDDRNSRSIQGMTHLLSGIAACRTGDLDEARRQLEALEQNHDPRNPTERWWYHLLLGETLLAEGDLPAAIMAFDSGEPKQNMPFNVIKLLDNLGGNLPLRDAPARARALAGNDRDAIALYAKLVRPDVAQKWTAALEPRHHVALARLYRKKGNREDASRHYRRFLELWSRADRDLPELLEAEEFLASS